jgi:hypothetical protein
LVIPIDRKLVKSMAPPPCKSGEKKFNGLYLEFSILGPYLENFQIIPGFFY